MRRLQFSIRGALVAFVVASVVLSGFATRLNSARRQAKTVRQLQDAGAWVEYGFQWDSERNMYDFSVPPPGPQWLRSVLGDHFFISVDRVVATGRTFSDQQLSSIEGIPTVRSLVLADTQVTDAGLAFLNGLEHLEHLELTGTQISDKGMAQLRLLRSLETLAIEDTQVTDDGLKHLEGLPRLKHLYVVGNHVTLAGIDRFRRARPDVTVDYNTALWQWMRQSPVAP